MDITECDICHDRDFEDVLNSIHYSSLNPDHEDDEVIEISPLRIVSVVVCTELRDTVLDLGLIYENLKSLEYVDVEDISYQEERPSKKEKKEQKKQINVFLHEGFWRCVDTARDLKLLKEMGLKKF